MFFCQNAGLGNRAPLPGYKRFQWCRWCKNAYNVEEKLNEVHILYSCPHFEQYRVSIGLAKYITKAESLVGTDPSEVYRHMFKVQAKESSDFKRELAIMLEQLRTEFMRRIGIA